jgi:hypothetical protein
MRVLLVLVILMGLAPAVALSVPVNPAALDQVAAWINNGSQLFVLRTNGEVWEIVPHHELEWQMWSVLPVPIGQVTDWQGDRLRTLDGTWWWRNVDSNEWSPVVGLPFGAIPIKQQSFTKMKTGYK